MSWSTNPKNQTGTRAEVSWCSCSMQFAILAKGSAAGPVLQVLVEFPTNEKVHFCALQGMRLCKAPRRKLEQPRRLIWVLRFSLSILKMLVL